MTVTNQNIGGKSKISLSRTTSSFEFSFLRVILSALLSKIPKIIEQNRDTIQVVVAKIQKMHFKNLSAIN